MLDSSSPGPEFWGCTCHSCLPPRVSILTLMEKDSLVLEPPVVKTISPSPWSRQTQEWDSRECARTRLVKDQ